MIKCLECNNLENEYNEQLGEIVCSSCGFVLIQNMFEERTSQVDGKGNIIHSKDTHRLGSILKSNSVERGLVYCNLVLSNIMTNHPLKLEVEKTYIECQRKRVYGNASFETRACATVYYVLKNNATPIPLKEIVSEYSCSLKLVRRIIKKMVKHYNNVSLNTKTQPSFLVEQLANKITSDLTFIHRCIEMCEEVEILLNQRPYNKRPSHYVAICYLVRLKYKYKISREKFSEKTGFDVRTITNTANELAEFMGFKKAKEIKMVK